MNVPPPLRGGFRLEDYFEVIVGGARGIHEFEQGMEGRGYGLMCGSNWECRGRLLGLDWSYDLFYGCVGFDICGGEELFGRLSNDCGYHQYDYKKYYDKFYNS